MKKNNATESLRAASALLKVKNHFPGWIGQADVIRNLNKVVSAILKDANVPLQPLFLEGFAGLGKTSLAKLIAEVLQPHGFSFVEIPSSITLPAFLQLWGNLIEGKKVVVFVDECAQIVKNKKVANLLKRVLETQRNVMPIAHDSGHITANPFQHFWIFASNEEPKDSALFGPSSRTKSLLLQPYTPEETQAIIAQKADKWGFKIDKDAIEYLSGRVMNNGRAISSLVEDDLLLHATLSEGKISLEVAKAIVQETKRFPLGLRGVDIKTLQCLSNEPRGRQVAELAMLCGGEDPKTTGDRLRALAGLGLVQTTANGRKAMTDKGAQYVRELAEAQKAAKAAKAKAKATPAKAEATPAKAKATAKPAKAKATKAEATAAAQG